MKVILYKPKIPQNTGNILRTCAVTGSELCLVTPLGFSISDRSLKRAGLDYWDLQVPITLIDNLEDYLEGSDLPFYFFSSKAETRYDFVSYTKDTQLIFGSETDGLPDSFHQRWPEKFVTLPMQPKVRCLNLATTVGISIYEAWRQLNFS